MTSPGSWLDEVSRFERDNKDLYKRQYDAACKYRVLIDCSPRWERGDVGLLTAVSEVFSDYDIQLLMPSGAVLFFRNSEVEAI